MRRAFTLLELLVVIAVVALVVGLLLPALAAARESGRTGVCLSNVRQIGAICWAYANDNRGVGPAIGEPYAALPNWALVVQTESGKAGAGPADLYTARSVLICPTVDAAYAEDMTRTYAMNATGHAGPAFGDPDNYDDPADPAFIRMDGAGGIARPSDTPIVVDSAVASFPGNAPPPTRTASVLDFRQPDHVQFRLGRFHDSGRRFHAGMFDGSARPLAAPLDHWTERLP